MAITSTTGTTLTLADLEAMPDDGRRYELLGGAIVMTPAPAPIHQLVSARLHAILQAATPEGYVAFAAPIDLDLPDGQRVEPDFVVAPWSSVGEQRLTVPVLLVVEIVSPGSTIHDRVTKRAVYAEAGIPIYWIVDLPAGKITALRLTVPDAYESDIEGTTVTLSDPLAVSLDLTELTRRPGPGPGQPNR